ncbi:MAG: tripartite tricarboxylate transporter substrate binding protein [Betaproteobacteria bacterium]|nr:tripartite tricarboxylate transporter substrate binding protein [Betaproteobacteria bacterium]
MKITMPVPTGIILALGMLASLCTTNGFSQEYPSKHIRIVVGSAAGGSTDTLARVLASNLSNALSKQVIVENRTGGSTSIAIQNVVSSVPDGHTLILLVSSSAALSAMGTKLPYDLERDLTFISQLATTPFVLVVNPSVPFYNVAGLVSYARANPGKLTYGSVGIGSIIHLAGELFSEIGNVKLLHVPYKGGSESTLALVGGQIDMNFTTTVEVLPLAKAGKLRILGVTGKSRLESLPSVPTLNESGLAGYDLYAWYGLAAPAGIPAAITARLNAEIVKIANANEFKKLLLGHGLEIRTGTPEEFASLIQFEIKRNSGLIKRSKMRAE